jgi:hypothetical protein
MIQTTTQEARCENPYQNPMQLSKMTGYIHGRDHLILQRKRSPASNVDREPMDNVFMLKVPLDQRHSKSSSHHKHKIRYQNYTHALLMFAIPKINKACV